MLFIGALGDLRLLFPHRPHGVVCWDGPDAFATAALKGKDALAAVSADSG